MSDNEEFESSESEEEIKLKWKIFKSFLSEGNHGFVFRVFFSQNWTFLLLLYASKNTRKRKTKVTGRLKIVCSF